MQPLEQWCGWDFTQEQEFSQCGRWVTTFAFFSRANDLHKEFVAFIIDHSFSIQGYQGLVDGGDNIKEVKWEEMSGILQLVCQKGIITNKNSN